MYNNQTVTTSITKVHIWYRPIKFLPVYLRKTFFEYVFNQPIFPNGFLYIVKKRSWFTDHIQLLHKLLLQREFG